MYQILISITLGVIAGTFTGLIPGIHTNLIAVLTISILSLSTIPSIYLAVFIFSMAITHTFVDFIPSIYFGAPEEETALSILPGHKMLLKGKAHEAIILTLKGSIIAILLTFPISFLFFKFLPPMQNFLERMIPFFLIWTLIFLIYENKEARVQATIILALAGFLGIATTNTPITQPLLPLLSGLFGVSTLLTSISKNEKIPEQNIEKKKYTSNPKKFIKPTIITFLISPICCLLPGIGASQAAIIGSKISRTTDEKQFLILLGSINTLVLSTSIIILHLIQKSRTGTANAIAQLIDINPTEIKILIITLIFSTILATILTISLSKYFAKNIHKWNYKKISLFVLVIIAIVTFTITSLVGLIILITSALLGILCINLRVKRITLMSSLIIPTIIFYI